MRSPRIFAREKRAETRHILWIWADLFVALGAVVAMATYLSIDSRYAGLLLVLASALASLGYLAGLTITTLVWLIRGRWGRAAAGAAKGTAFVALFTSCVGLGDYVHLALFYPEYRQQIAAQDPGHPVQVRFDWGDKALWVTDGFQGETLVYDQTDSLMNAIGDVRESRAGLGLATRHLVGHFYIEYEFSR